ncbi:FAD:protein FMN transferase [Patulibacter sp. SYSU D01012]|uniref:FAD:protein FMN transferase n=1 Tax=Patulibacter sp. SYSU D01012 TaxID=2817381 RepID=UPI001B30FD89|nr:FAD:protein FMN transferase [Patulibacter sp. SYSU D01012]
MPAPAPAAAPPRHGLSFDAIGTRWRIDAAQPLDGVADDVAALVDRYDRTWSRFRPDSLVARMAREGGSHPLPPEGPALLTLLRRLHDATGGAVTPLVGGAMEHHGYDAAYSLTPRPGEPEVPAWDATVAHVGRRIELRRPVLLDVGAAGKGQLVDLVGALLTARGIADHVVDAGGDLRTAGPAPLRVALEQPGDPTRAIGVVELADAAIAASGIDRRAWADRHHVLDGRTGAPTRDVVATWAIAPTAMEADGLATALFFVPPERLERAFACTGVRVFADGRYERSAALPGELFA